MLDYKVKLTVSYDGGSFFGFQRQREEPTVQSVLSEALETINQQPVVPEGAGRTDSGVHALGQVVCFTPEVNIPLENWPGAINGLCPSSLVVRKAEKVCADFDPIRWARYKHYRYLIDTSGLILPFYDGYVYKCRYDDLDTEAMGTAAAELLGKCDFASFQVSGRPVQSTVRTMYQIGVHEGKPDRIVVDMIAGGYLYKMARSIVGTLIEVGRGSLNIQDFREVIDVRDRTAAGPTAPPEGLYLVAVKYDI